MQELCHCSWSKLLVARKLSFVVLAACPCLCTRRCDVVGMTEALITAAFRILSISLPSASGLRFHTANLSQTKEIIQRKGISSEWVFFNEVNINHWEQNTS